MKCRLFLTTFSVSESGGLRHVINPLIEAIDAQNIQGIECRCIYSATHQGDGVPDKPVCLVIVRAQDATDLSNLDTVAGVRSIPATALDIPLSNGQKNKINTFLTGLSIPVTAGDTLRATRDALIQWLAPADRMAPGIDNSAEYG